MVIDPGMVQAARTSRRPGLTFAAWRQYVANIIYLQPSHNVRLAIQIRNCFYGCL